MSTLNLIIIKQKIKKFIEWQSYKNFDVCILKYAQKIEFSALFCIIWHNDNSIF